MRPSARVGPSLRAIPLCTHRLGAKQVSKAAKNASVRSSRDLVEEEVENHPEERGKNEVDCYECSMLIV